MKVMATLLFAAVATSSLTGETITVDGSTTVGPVAKAFAEYYMAQNPDVNISVSESGSGNGAKGLINGTCAVADMSRFMKESEFKAAVDNGVQPVAHVVAVDGIVMVVHPSNPVKALTTQQVKDIYLGKIANWKQVGGPDRKIVKINRETTSGTFECFEELVMDKEKIDPAAESVGSNGAARQRVQSTAGAIGYVGLGFVDRTLKALAIDGVAPTRRTIATGKYPISRPLFMFTDGYPKLGSHLHAFVTLHLTRQGQEIVSAIGYVPVTDYEEPK